MKLLLIFSLVIVLAWAQVYKATCYLKGTKHDPTIVGKITFTQNATNSSHTEVHAEISGISQYLNNNHGMHIHTWGDISSNDGMAALGHWFIGNETHGCPDSETRHSGDMGNWFVFENGTVSQTKLLDKLPLTGPNSIIGRAVIFHNVTDDCSTPPAGNSGVRLAQCVIGIANATNNLATNSRPANLDGDTDTAICVFNPVPGGSTAVQGYALMRKTAAQSRPTITVVIFNATNSAHGMHIHEFGDISGALNVGGHWNPYSQNHGMPGFTRHLGDLGNAYYSVQGSNNTLYYRHDDNDLLTPVGGANNVLGRALIIHAARDDCTNPIGNSGGRLATCVWGLAFSGNFTSGTDLNAFGVTFPQGVPVGLDTNSLYNCSVALSVQSTSQQSTQQQTTQETQNTNTQTSQQTMQTSQQMQTTQQSTQNNSDDSLGQVVAASFLLVFLALFL